MVEQLQSCPEGNHFSKFTALPSGGCPIVDQLFKNWLPQQNVYNDPDNL